MSSLRALLPMGGIVSVAVAISGCTAPGGSPEEDWRQGRIVFDSERDGNFEIYVMNADGSNQQNLTNYSRDGDQFPAWSPDDKRIMFTSWGREDGLRAAIFAMDPDGSNVTRLSKSIGKQDAPRFPGDRASFSRWSPDGKRILFLNSGGENVFDIFVMDADGSNVQRLTTTPGAGNSEDPDWSPDGNWIAFHSNRDGSTQIYVMATDGSNVKRLTDTGGAKPRWSPDGQRILFDSNGDRHSDSPLEVMELYVMDADGSNIRRLTYTTDKGESSFDGVWSPDGRKIAFVSGSGARSRAGEKTRALATGDVSARWWESREIYVMDDDGSNVQRLTFNDAFDGHPHWQSTRR